MVYIMSHDRNPYYDSARDKPDRSEFASLRMDIQTKRPASGGGSGVLKIVACVVVLVVIAAVVKRFVLT